MHIDFSSAFHIQFVSSEILCLIVHSLHFGFSKALFTGSPFCHSVQCSLVCLSNHLPVCSDRASKVKTLKTLSDIWNWGTVIWKWGIVIWNQGTFFWPGNFKTWNEFFKSGNSFWNRRMVIEDWFFLKKDSLFSINCSSFSNNCSSFLNNCSLI